MGFPLYQRQVYKSGHYFCLRTTTQLSTKELNNGLSRLPLQVDHLEKKDAVELFYLGQVEKLPVSVTDIQCETMSAATLATVVEMVLKGAQAVSLTDKLSS